MTKEFDDDDFQKKMDLKISEFGRKYVFGGDKIIDFVATTVIAGHHWAKYRDFDTSPDKYKEIEEWKTAEKELRNFYNGKPLKKVLEDMINRQANVIYLRRQVENIPDPPNHYDRDKWEAKRYIAYLFFDEILYGCVHDHLCPDFDINLISQEVVDLLRSLTIEEYCRIKAYVVFLDNRKNIGNQAYYKDDLNYYNALSLLDKAFQNCKRRKNATLQNGGWLNQDVDTIRKAKRKTEDRIGPIPKGIIKDFVNKFYPYINQLPKNSHGKEETIKILSRIYDKSNTKIINVIEFMLKCMIASHVSDDEYNEIRINAGKNKKRKRPAPESIKRHQVMPFFS